MSYSAKKLAQHGRRRAASATKYAQQTSTHALAATKLAQQTPAQACTAKRLAQHGKNRPFWPIFGTLGEKFRVCNVRTPRRANFLAQLEPRPASMKPTAPLPNPDEPPLKPLMPRCTHTQSRMQFHDCLHRRVRENGENSRLCHRNLKDSLGNCMRNCRAPGKTTHKAGPVIIHRPRLVNLRVAQARTERS